jgi:hypothetical protein
MRAVMKLMGFALVLGSIYVIGCGEDPKHHSPGPTGPVSTTEDGMVSAALNCSTSATLDNEEDIEAWVSDACCGAVLTVVEGSYSFNTLGFCGTGCQAATIIGNGSLFEFSGSLPGGPEQTHAYLWFTENIDKPNLPSRLEDINLSFSGIDQDGFGLEFELCYAEMENVTLEGEGTSRLWGVLGFAGNNVTLASEHTFYARGFPNGSLLENSDLQGRFVVNTPGGWGPPLDSAASSATEAVFTFRHNVMKDLDLNSTLSVKRIDLIDNDFVGTGVTVSADTSIHVVAEENSNANADSRCKCDAEAAFSIGSSSTLDLNSWEYHASGSVDSIWGIPTLTDVTSSRECNDITVYWDTDFRSTSKVTWGYSSGSLTHSARGDDSLSHAVTFTVDGSEGTIYFKAISGPPGCVQDEVESEEETNTDGVYVPVISELAHSRSAGNVVTVTWETSCVGTSKVLWGYASGNLPNTATGPSGTSHTVQFSVAATEGCVYLKAVSENPDTLEVFDESDEVVDVKTIVISNVQRTWNPATCQVDVTWQTNVNSSSAVVYGPTSCSGTVVTGPGNTTNHVVSFDPEGYDRGDRIYIKAMSENACCSAVSSSCAFVAKGYCF